MKPVWFILSVVLGSIWSHGCQPRALDSDTPRVDIVFIHSKIPGTTYLTGVVQAFERENPGIRVREQILPSNSDDQHQFYAINLPAGATDFDIVDMDVIWVQEFARAGWIEDLTGLVPERDLDQLNASALGADWLEGRLYGVPWFVDAGVLYYRRDLLDKYGFQPPQTFEELLQTSEEILDRERDPRLTGFVWQGMQYEGLVCVALEFIRGNGGNILTSGEVPTLTEPAALDALNFMRDLIQSDHISPESVTTLNEEATRRMFESGRAIFMRNWPYAWPLINQEGSPVAGRVGVTSVPHFSGHTSAPTLGGYHLGINKHSLHKKEAAAFLRFMIREQTQKQIALELGFLPAHSGVYQDPEVRERLTILPFIQESLHRLQPRPVSPYYLMISQILQPELSAIVAGIRSPREAMGLAQEQILHLMGAE
jgi:multiple sugar transport system substrate-binding protein